MKKILTLVLIVFLTLALTGCSMIIEQARRILAGGDAPGETTLTEQETTAASTTGSNQPEETTEPIADYTVEGAPLIHHFEFEGSFADSLPTGIELQVHANTGTNRLANGEWQWSASSHPGGGLILLTDKITDPEDYSIGFRIRFNEVSPSWRKILSFKDASDDGGLYFYNGYLQLYPFSFNDAISYETDTYYDFILSRNPEGVVTVYVVQSDNSIVKVYEDVDTTQATVPVEADGFYQFMFFIDDDTTSSEWTSGGAVRNIRIWDGPVDKISFD